MNNTYRTIFWDFDGVLMDSMPVRNHGFEQVLSDFPKSEVQQLMTYHLKNGGLSRYVKFRYFFEVIREESISEEEVRNWAEKFSAIMLENLINEELLIAETMGFVRENHQQFNMHIVSGSDGTELQEICNRLDIAKYFQSINGSPTPKKNLVQDIIEKKKLEKKSCVLIGDSINDYDAAKANGIDFYGYNNQALAHLGNYVDSFININF